MMDELRMHENMSNLIGWEPLSLIKDVDKDNAQTNSLPLTHDLLLKKTYFLVLHSFLLPTALLATGYGFLICGRVLPSKKSLGLGYMHHRSHARGVLSQ